MNPDHYSAVSKAVANKTKKSFKPNSFKMAKHSGCVVAEHLPGFNFIDMSSDKEIYFRQVLRRLSTHWWVETHIQWEETATMHS